MGDQVNGKLRKALKGAVAGAAGTTVLDAVGYADMALHGNAAAAAISSAPLARRIGMCSSTMRRLTGSSIQDRLIGVTVAPGPMPFTLIRREAYSTPATG
jgi:hypothetical protein